MTAEMAGFEEKFKKGTTTVGLLASDGIVLATERRATMGNLIANKETRKIVQIADHIALTIAGGVGDAQMIGRIMRAQAALYEIQHGRRIPVEAAATLLGNILQANKYFPYFVQLILAGYDTKPHLYSLDLAGSVLPEKFVSTGSGSPVAYGVLEDRFREGKPIKENIPLAAKAVRAAIERDAFSGNGVELALLTRAGFRYVEEKEIKDLLSKTE